MKRKYFGYIVVAALAVYVLQAYMGTPATSEYGFSSAEASSVSFSQEHDKLQEGLYWANPKTLSDHFKRHGADFNAVDEDDYARKAHELYEGRDEFQVKADKDGVIRVYDPDTSAFGAYNADGTTRTFFKPSDGQRYFDRQPGE